MAGCAVNLREEYDFFSEQEVGRFNVVASGQSQEDPRSPFEHDRGRIIHSGAFRSLQGKTQIFEPHAADFLRTRLTHSIEVAQIGRGLADRFGVPASLVEAACLGHDLGHPPFGHTGEEVLNEKMEDHGGYEGNAQTFRIVTRLEPKHKDYKGLDLTRGTQLGLLKYPFRRNEETKEGKFLYLDDTGQAEMDWLFEGTGLGLLDEPSLTPPRTLPCQLMDWADDIAYSVHDLEDGIASGLLQPSTWTSDGFQKTIYKSVKDVASKVLIDEPAPTDEEVTKALDPLVRQLSGRGPEIPLDIIRELSRSLIDDFVTASEVEAVGDGKSLFDFELRIPRETRILNQVLKGITIEYLLRGEITAGVFFKGHEILDRLFEAFYGSCRRTRPRDRYLLFPPRLRGPLKVFSDNQADQRRLICDYLAGLTEGQVRKLYARFFEPGNAQLGL